MAAVLLLLAMIASTATATTVTPNSTKAASTPQSSNEAIQAAQKFHNRVFVGYVLLLAITVLGTCLVWSSGNKVQDAVQADANARISEATAKAAEANEKAETEKLARLRLEKEVSPRRLTGEQRAKLTKLLEQYPDPVGIIVVSSFLDSESSDFADDFNTAITDAKWKTLRLKDRLTQKTGVSLGVLEGTPMLDPWGRPIISLKQRVGGALKAIGVSYHDVTFGKDDIKSIGAEFKMGPIYLVVERKPPIKIGEAH
jgi:hypothetical protein